MTDLRAAAQQALEALEKCSAQLTRLGYSANHADQVVPTVRAALEQPVTSGLTEVPSMRNFFTTVLQNGGVARFEFCDLVDVEKAKLAIEAACDVIDGPVVYEPPCGLLDALRRWWNGSPTQQEKT